MTMQPSLTTLITDNINDKVALYTHEIMSENYVYETIMTALVFFS